MNAHRSPVRNGRMCDQCGLPNFPPGWYHGEWMKFIDYPNSTSEGYGGLVLCGTCYAGHVERLAGPEYALAVLTDLMRAHQRAVVRMRERGQERREAREA